MKRFARPARTAIAAVVALTAMTACTVGGASSGQSGSEGGVTLSFLTFETPNLTAAKWDAAIARTTAKVPGVTIKKLVAPSADRTSYAKQLAASGQLPDILIAVSPADFVKAGSLAPFDTSALGKFTDSTANQIDGRTYQLPWASQAVPLVYYNKEAFTKAGIATPPTTWAQFLDANARLKAAGIKPIQIGGGGADTFANSYPLVGAVGTDLYTSQPTFLSDVKAGTASFTDPRFVAAAQKVADLASSGYLAKGDLSLSYAGSQQEFLDGKAAMYPMGTWFPAAADAKAPAFGIGVFPWPSDDGSLVVPTYTGGGITVSSKAPDVALAQQWAIEFSTQSANLDEQVKADSLFMAIKDYTPPAEAGPVYRESLAIYQRGLDTKKVTTAFGSETGSDALPSGTVTDLYTGIADLINGSKTAQEFAAFLDASYEKNSVG